MNKELTPPSPELKAALEAADSEDVKKRNRARDRWRIYYGDGSTYEGDPFYAPAQNVIVIIRYGPNENALCHSISLRGYYVYKNGMWDICDEVGYWDYMLNWKEPRIAIFGRSLKDKIYELILAKAIQDKEFLMKPYLDTKKA